jgi:hypothetical protein
MAPARNNDFSKIKIGEIARCFCVSVAAVDKWVTMGCPQNSDRTMGIYQVHRWLMQREINRHCGVDDKNKSLKDKKTEKEIERLEAQINKIQEKTIERELHDAICNSRARDAADNWSRMIMKNAVYLAMKPIDELKVLLMRFLCEGTAAMVTNNDDKKKITTKTSAILSSDQNADMNAEFSEEDDES